MNSSANSPDSVALLLGLPTAYFTYSPVLFICESHSEAAAFMREKPSLVQQMGIDHLVYFKSHGASPRLKGEVYKSS